MREPLRTLIVEDSENDVLLLLRELRKGGYEPLHARVETEEELRSALADRNWDLVLSDYSMPRFDGPTALAVLQSTGLDIPFIVVSGTVGEDVAVETMRAGASDYLLKGSLTRLAEAVRREIRDAAIRREHKRNIGKIEHLNKVLNGIRTVNQLIVREKDPGELLRLSCDALVNSRGYQAAWIALTESQASSATMTSQTGFGSEFDRMSDRLREGFLPPCCTKALAAHGTVPMRQDDCPPECPLTGNPDAGCRKFPMSLVAPLWSNETNYGFVCAGIPEGLGNDEEEASLVWEVARDIAFSLRSIAGETERRRIEGLFQRSFTSAGIGKCLISVDGGLTEVNQSLCDLLGYGREELTTKHVDDLTHPNDRARTREHLRSLLEGQQQSYRIEKQYLCEDGRSIWVDVSTILLRNDEDGSPRCFISEILDVSERKRAEEMLRERSAQLSNALDMARAGDWEFDVNRNTFTFNDNFYRIFRTSAEEVGGYEMSPEEYARRFCHPDDIGIVRDEVRAAIESPDPNFTRQIEHRIRYADGTSGHMAVRFFVTKDEGDAP